jgi:hypothetical protein
MLQDGFNQSQTRVSDKKKGHGLVSQGSMGSKLFLGTYQSEGYASSWLGPRALYFNVFLHPEILSSKPEEETETVQKFLD